MFITFSLAAQISPCFSLDFRAVFGRL